MRMKLKALLCAASLVSLAGCAIEAGSQIDEGGFGNPTMNNTLAQLATRCGGQAKGYIVPDPVVVRDPGSSEAFPRYRLAQVRCLGGLNGKYAEVIFGEYVASATELPTGEQADAQSAASGG